MIVLGADLGTEWFVRYTATQCAPQTLGRVFLAPGREQILLMGPVSPEKLWNVTFTHWLFVWNQVMLYLFYLFLFTWIPGLDPMCHWGLWALMQSSRVHKSGKHNWDPSWGLWLNQPQLRVDPFSSVGCGGTARCEAKQKWRFNSQDPHPRMGKGWETCVFRAHL